jgi:membrane-bound lytic murein transglycosylase B
MQCYINLHHQQNNVLNSNQQPVFHPLIPDLHLQKPNQNKNGQNRQNGMHSWDAWNAGSGVADYNQVWNQDAGIPNSYANLIIDDSRSNQMGMGMENNYTSTKYNAPTYNNKRW